MIKETFLNLPNKKYKKIIDGSHLLFNEFGFDRLTIKEVVNHTKISRGSFYQYFDSLYDLFYACVIDTANKKLSYLKPVMEKLGTIPFLDLYKEMIEASLTFANSYPLEIKTSLILYHSTHPDIKKMLSMVEEEGLSMFESFIKTDQSQGFIDANVDAKMLSRVLYMFNAYELLNRFKNGDSMELLVNYSESFLSIIKSGVI